MCEQGNHQVGQLGSKTIRRADWDQAVVDFGRLIDDFNVRGQREQVNHPGWCTTFDFCPECGSSLRSFRLRNVQINS